MEETKIIKELYERMYESASINEPKIYLMPLNFYNEIMKKIAYLDRALKLSRGSRDMWKKKYDDLKSQNINKASLEVEE